MESAKTMKAVLSIAGSDSIGGAGIQADLKTMSAFGVYGMTAITALTAQNTLGVQGVMEVSPEFLALQLESIFQDMMPQAIKIGMVSSSPLIQVIEEKLRKYPGSKLVLDPVMVATSGSTLLKEEAIASLKEKLLPLADLVTPNIPEAEILSGIEIHSHEEMEEAGRIISKAYGCAVLCKGGHHLQDAHDVLVDQGKIKWFYGKRIANPNTHGTGCTLSSAIASSMAQGKSMEDSIALAKEYISGALQAMLDLGQGSGPLNHMWQKEKEKKE